MRKNNFYVFLPQTKMIHNISILAVLVLGTLVTFEEKKMQNEKAHVTKKSRKWVAKTTHKKTHYWSLISLQVCLILVITACN